MYEIRVILGLYLLNIYNFLLYRACMSRSSIDISNRVETWVETRKLQSLYSQSTLRYATI